MEPGGGIVPGVGRGDIVPAMLEPGEGVIPKRIMEGYKAAPSERGGGHTIHFHYRPTNRIQAIDRSGVQEMLENHEAEFHKSAERMLRNLNRG